MATANVDAHLGLALSRIPAGRAERCRSAQMMGQMTEGNALGFQRRGALEYRVVELRGFEPLAFSLRTRRATNCATAPYLSRKGTKSPRLTDNGLLA